MARKQTKLISKPTVFLSHSSANRRELLRLKRFLDERAGGMIEFFLSSDDESIAHGSIWPSEVQNALDRMSLMLVFVSKEALKSGWTYFEAGYGLNKLRTANIYCLPGIDKAGLPPPFNVIQNRNLHSARDLSLLVQQCNEFLGGSLNVNVTKAHFQSVFTKPIMGPIETGPRVTEVLASIDGEAEGPPDSLQLFEQACAQQKRTFSAVRSEDVWGIKRYDTRCSTGIEFTVENPEFEEGTEELAITDEIQQAGGAFRHDLFPESAAMTQYYSGKNRWMKLEEIESYNAEARETNERIRKENAEKKDAPRPCRFDIATIATDIAVGLLDTWLALSRGVVGQIRLKWLPEIDVEKRPAAIAAKILDTALELQRDNTLLWQEQSVLRLNEGGLEITSFSNSVSPIADLKIEALIAVLVETGILSLPRSRGTRR